MEGRTTNGDESMQMFSAAGLELEWLELVIAGTCEGKSAISGDPRVRIWWSVPGWDARVCVRARNRVEGIFSSVKIVK